MSHKIVCSDTLLVSNSKPWITRRPVPISGVRSESWLSVNKLFISLFISFSVHAEVDHWPTFKSTLMTLVWEREHHDQQNDLSLFQLVSTICNTNDPAPTNSLQINDAMLGKSLSNWQNRQSKVETAVDCYVDKILSTTATIFCVDDSNNKLTTMLIIQVAVAGALSFFPLSY